MASYNVTIEIDTNTIRLMETSQDRIVRWASLSLDPTIFQDGVISDPQALSTAVRQLMESSGIRARDVIASISGLYSVSRIVAVPNQPGGIVTPEVILEAASNMMPLSLDELYLSWQTVTSGDDGQRVLVVGVPKDMIDVKMLALRAAGINPRILDLKTIALARAVNKKQALILNIEPSNFDIVIVVNSVPEVMRTIAWQHDGFTEEDRVEYLAMNMDLTVGFYNSHHLNTPLDSTTPIIITGQMSRDLDLMEKLPASIGYPIESLAPPLECPEHMPVSQYAVNIGLALKGRIPSAQDSYLPPDINLLPEAYKPWRPSTRQLYLAGAAAVAVALLFPLFQLTSGAMTKTANLQAEHTNLNNKLLLTQAEIRSREPLKQAITDYNTIVNMGGGFTEDLRIIKSEAARLGVQVESINHNGKSITVDCLTEPKSYITFRNYVSALEESGRFATVTPPAEKFSYITGGSIELEPKPGE